MDDPQLPEQYILPGGVKLSTPGYVEARRYWTIAALAEFCSLDAESVTRIIEYEAVPTHTRTLPGAVQPTTLVAADDVMAFWQRRYDERMRARAPEADD
jgi:hypothetical protein